MIYYKLWLDLYSLFSFTFLHSSSIVSLKSFGTGILVFAFVARQHQCYASVKGIQRDYNAILNSNSLNSSKFAYAYFSVVKRKSQTMLPTNLLHPLTSNYVTIHLNTIDVLKKAWVKTRFTRYNHFLQSFKTLAILAHLQVYNITMHPMNPLANVMDVSVQSRFNSYNPYEL